MADDLKEQLKETITAQDNLSSGPEQRQPQKDSLGRSYATGRRKDAVARVWLKHGKGQITVNGKIANAYFTRPVLQMIIRQPFDLTKTENIFDIHATVKGGGLSGQAGAVRHGIAQSLNLFDPALRSILKSAGLLRRDSRTVERKKYGHAKARKRFQFSKR